VYPYDFNDRGRYHFSHSVYSDDHGKTWNIGGDIGPEGNECCAAEIKDGVVYMSVRIFPRKGKRAYSISKDGGVSWGPLIDTELPDPSCQGSVLAGPKAGKNGFYPLYLSNVANSSDRRGLTIRTSYDGGATWPESRHIEEGFSAYSDIAILDEHHLACYYEAGGAEQKPYGEIVFTILNI
jgi:sialidase-1